MSPIRSYALFLLFFASMTTPLIGKELYDDKKISHIEVIVDGEERIDPESILSKMKTKEGEDFSQSAFDADLKSLSLDYDKVEPTVALKNGALYITLHIAPKPIIQRIEWRGNEQFRTSFLQKELDIKSGEIFERKEFRKSFGKLKDYYFKKGYFESQLNYHIVPSGPGQIDIIIDIYEGKPGYIKKIVLNGFSKEERGALEEQMLLKNYNFLTSWLTGSGIYRDELLEQDKMTIVNYLHNEGYADAKVDIHLIDDPNSGKLIVKIDADKGELYHFGKISFQGNEVLPSEEIAKKTDSLEGQRFSPEKLRETGQSIKNLYGQKGHIDASVQFETTLKEEAPLFDTHFYIEEGQEYKVGLIHIFGNVSTASNVILRESLLVPGETFDARKLKATQQRLEAIGYFKNVNVFAVRSQDNADLGSNYRDVYIEVEETSTGNVSLFMGFSSMDDIYGGLDLTERNFNIRGIGKALTGKISSLRGGGEFFHARGTVGKKQNNILLSWMNPYVNDSLWRLGVELSRTFSKLQENVVVVTYGGSVSASYPLSSYWTAGMRQRLRHSKDDLRLDPLDNSIIAEQSVEKVRKELNQDGLISAFSTNLGYDSTDNAYKPHRGWFSFFESEISGVGGKYNFFKLSYINRIYFPLSKRGTLKLRGDFKFIVPFGDTKRNGVPYSERFFLGGETNVRGYKPFLLGPVVELQNSLGTFEKTDTPYGGLSSSLLSLEYNLEIFRMLDVFAFFDVGSLSFQEFEIDKIRPSTGVGLRLDIGNRTPIMLGWGIPLVKKDRHEGKWQKVFFSMGGQF